MQKLMNTLGYQFKDPALLKRALTHPSMGGEDNQRLEFLGDAVLEICVSRVLYHKFPKLKEGQLTRRRAALVCEANLAEAARRFDLGSFLKLDRGEEIVGGRENPSILADTMEAVIAAVYLDAGVEKAAKLVGGGGLLREPVALPTQPEWQHCVVRCQKQQKMGYHPYFIENTKKSSYIINSFIRLFYTTTRIISHLLSYIAHITISSCFQNSIRRR